MGNKTIIDFDIQENNIFIIFYFISIMEIPTYKGANSH